MREAVVLAALGPNPAPWIELLWALARQHDLLVTDAFVVVDRRGFDFLHDEALAPGAALDELRACLDPDLLPPARLRVCVARGPDGSPLLDDDESQDAEAYQATLWDAALAALECAAGRPLVFGLTAGRRRTMTALMTATFQLLARPHDLCVDVRVSDRRAEGGSGFFFPEQRDQHILTLGGLITAADVNVRLIEVALPRLRGLLEGASPPSYRDALSTGQRAIDHAAAPTLRLDLARGLLTVRRGTSAEHPLPLSPDRFLCYSLLALRRLDDPGEGWLAHDHLALPPRLAPWTTAPWAAQVRNSMLRRMLAGERVSLLHNSDDDAAYDGPLRKLRSDTTSAVEKWCRQQDRGLAPWLVPEKSKHDYHHRARLRLPARHIELTDADGNVTGP